MTDYTANLSKHAVLVASTVDRVTMGGNYVEVTVFNRSATDPLFVRVDGADPTVNGDDSRLVPVRTSRVLGNPNPANANEVRLISPGAAGYSVEVG
jgi:hypothetical protein